MPPGWRGALLCTRKEVQLCHGPLADGKDDGPHDRGSPFPGAGLPRSEAAPGAPKARSLFQGLRLRQTTGLQACGCGVWGQRPESCRSGWYRLRFTGCAWVGGRCRSSETWHGARTTVRQACSPGLANAAAPGPWPCTESKVSTHGIVQRTVREVRPD